MKIIKTASGMRKLSMNYAEWKQIGESQGWFDRIDQEVEKENKDFRDRMRKLWPKDKPWVLL